MPHRHDRNRPDRPAPHAEIDRVVHERARLVLLTSLIAHPSGLSFAALKQLGHLTDGNLSRHLQVLENEGIVGASKSSGAHRPQTSYRLTVEGRQRYFDYLAVLEKLITEAAKAARAARRKSVRLPAGG